MRAAAPDSVRQGERTHYCDWDVPGRRLVRALCGAPMRRLDHVNHPTCEACAAVLAQRNQQEDVF